MSGVEIIACVAAVITAAQGAAELTAKIRARRKKRLLARNHVLEDEFSLSLKDTHDDLRQRYTLFSQRFGGSWPFDDAAYHRMMEVKAEAMAIHMFLQFVYNNQEVIKDPRDFRKRIESAHFTAKHILDLQLLSAPPQFAQPPAAATAAYRGLLPPVSPIPEGQTPVKDQLPMTSVTSLENVRDRGPFEHREIDWLKDWKGFAGLSIDGTTISSKSDNRLSKISVADLGSQQTLGAEENRKDSGTPSSRDSIISHATTSSSKSTSTTPIPSSARLLAKSDRNCSASIEMRAADVKGLPCKKNNWHGFCQGAWDITENAEALSLVHRPVGNFSTEVFLMCKQCNFRGRLGPQPSHKSKTCKVPDMKVYTAKCGIRFRWIFLAKCHEKNKTSTLTGIADQANNAAYRCSFCYLNHDISLRLGGVETLMNHIYLEHRKRDMTARHLNRLKCVIGEIASDAIDFDINIPEYAEAEERGEVAASRGAVTDATDASLSFQVELPTEREMVEAPAA